MRSVKQGAAFTVSVKMVQASDHVSDATGLTLTVTVKKSGAAFAAAPGSGATTVTERGSGWYDIAFTAGSNVADTLGDLVIRATASGADPGERALVVAPGLVDVDVSSRTEGGVYTAPNNAGIASILTAVDTEIAAILSKVNALPASPAAVGDIPTAATVASAVRTNLTTELGRLDASVGSRLDATGVRTALGLVGASDLTDRLAAILAGLDAVSLAADGLDGVFPETGINARQMLALTFAEAVGRLSGADTSTIIILAGGGTSERIRATVDAAGNRTAIVLSPPA